MNRKHIKLGVNIDHIAFIKKSRNTDYPDLLKAVDIAQEAGADQITIHLREDRRHIQDIDVKNIRSKAQILNLEMALTEEMVAVAMQNKPNFCCLVPEKREEITTEGGLDLIKMNKSKLNYLKETIIILNKNNIQTSIFIDPDIEQIEKAINCEAKIIELHTGAYANSNNKTYELEKLKNAAHFASQNNISVNAGHGLNIENVGLICDLPHIKELNIGHSIIARSVYIGLKDAIKEMISIIRG
ncbi:MAG: pyridoxine 5'-phosphate synthase [Gammaproteobacteria bacterium]|nr:pyridoxine 5'-phosphate synthase [Gammaproteobacteria bacterium]|tara:strand:- start:1678 stop:2406 length:729 start_codon:yes stop_codon:yes gene_type:complete